jgi:hypothetical protein
MVEWSSGQRNDLSGQFRSHGGPQLNGALFEGPVSFGHTDTGKSICNHVATSRLTPYTKKTRQPSIENVYVIYGPRILVLTKDGLKGAKISCCRAYAHG